MTKKTVNRMSWGRLITGAVIVSLSIIASILFSRLAVYNRELGNFSLAVSSSDRQAAEKGLANLKKSYSFFSNLGLQYFADRYLFNEMYKYEAAVSYVNEDWEKTVDLLAGHEDDFSALYMRGIAKFKILHAAYHSAAAKKDKQIRDDILRRVLEEVRSDFEAAVKAGPGPDLNFNSSYNYDLTSDPASAQRALESIKPAPRFILGTKSQGDKPGRERKRPLDKRVDDPSPGSGDLRKRG